MRTAILISGHVRRFLDERRLQAGWRNMLARLGGCDVYCHTWSKLDHRPGAEPTPPDRLGDVIQPTALRVDELPDAWPLGREFPEAERRTHPSYPLARIEPQWWSLARAAELMRDSGREYDLVVRHRLDFIAEFTPRPVDGVVAPQVAARWRRSPLTILDNHAYGSPRAMQVYTSLHAALPELLPRWPELLAITLGDYLDSESLLAFHLHQQVVPVIQDPSYRLWINKEKGAYVRRTD